MKKFAIVQRYDHIPKIGVLHDDIYKFVNWHYTRHFPRKNLIRVNLSMSQWSELICSVNIGEGVPCTLQYVNGEHRDQLTPADETVQEEYTREFKESTKEIDTGLAMLEQKFKDLMAKQTIGKRDKEEFLKELGLVRQHVNSNLPFVVEQFTEAVEKIQVTAKHELVAWTQANAIQNDSKLMIE